MRGENENENESSWEKLGVHFHVHEFLLGFLSFPKTQQQLTAGGKWRGWWVGETRSEKQHNMA